MTEIILQDLKKNILWLFGTLLYCYTTFSSLILIIKLIVLYNLTFELLEILMH